MKNKFTIGFTLVEMLVVIMILGILAAIVVPKVFQSVDDAKIFQCQSRLDTLGKYLQMYKSKHNGKYPKETGSKLWVMLVDKESGEELDSKLSAEEKEKKYIDTTCPVDDSGDKYPHYRGPKYTLSKKKYSTSDPIGGDRFEGEMTDHGDHRYPICVLTFKGSAKTIHLDQGEGKEIFSKLKKLTTN